jgi:acylphosphatase
MSAGKPIARRFLVAGKVQGVFFRASTWEQAQHLGVTGHARNLADGRVEVVAFGSAAAITALEAWLRQGPPSARVDDVTSEPLDLAPPATFRTL